MVTARIVRMFQRYAQNIDPEDERFIGHITHYLIEKGVKDPKSLVYSDLYKLIKEGIGQYLRKQESRPAMKE
jgi:hypothetical protein